MSSQYVSLKVLNDKTKNPKVKVRISRRWLPISSKDNEIFFLSLVMVDEEGGTMYGIAWKKDIAKYKLKLQEGKVYEITNFIVNETKGELRVVTNDSFMVFKYNTFVKELVGEHPSIPSHHFSFTDFNTLRLRLNKDTYLTCIFKPFGGITIVLGGDFRQILPVIPKGVHGQIVVASLRRSNIWTYINVLSLNQNMRLSNEDVDKENFAKYLIQIGSDPKDVVQLPTSINRCHNLSNLIDCVYPGINRTTSITPEYLTERTILSSRNDDVATINTEILNMVHGEVKTYLAADSAPKLEGNSESNGTRYPTEFLNSLNPPGLPPFKLQIKVGCPIMLLRNLAPKEGLCNGTRLMVVRSKTRIIEARILTGDNAGKLVFITRISLIPSSTESPVQMKRRQFPIRLAYAMTINKSQGESVTFVGIDLRTPVFSHGQLYVALSRCTLTRRINVLLPEEEDENNSTTNIVYPEVLL